jgi:hypothetical protein
VRVQGGPLKATHCPPRASIHLALNLGFPEISPGALGARYQARPRAVLARRTGLGGVWTARPLGPRWAPWAGDFVLEGKTLVSEARRMEALSQAAETRSHRHPRSSDLKDWELLAVFCEPLQHGLLVFFHPLDVGFGLFQSLLQSPGARAKACLYVVLLELLQLPGKRRLSAPSWVCGPPWRGEEGRRGSPTLGRPPRDGDHTLSPDRRSSPSPLAGAKSSCTQRLQNHSPMQGLAQKLSDCHCAIFQSQSGGGGANRPLYNVEISRTRDAFFLDGIANTYRVWPLSLVTLCEWQLPP